MRSSPNALQRHSSLVEHFAEYARNKLKYSKNTIEAYTLDVTAFERRLATRNIPIDEVTKADVIHDMQSRLRDDGVQPASVARQLVSIRAFYRAMVAIGAPFTDPTEGIMRPKYSRPSQQAASREVLDTVLTSSDLSSPFGFRNHVMLMMLCMTSIRTSLLVNLTDKDLDLITGHVYVPGKKGESIAIKLPPQVFGALKEYIHRQRPKILEGRKSKYVFPTLRKTAMTRQALWHIARKCARRSGVSTRSIRSHDLRYAYSLYFAQA